MTSVVKLCWRMAVYYFLLYPSFIEEAAFVWLLGRGGTTFIGNLTLDQNYALTTDHSMPGRLVVEIKLFYWCGLT